MRTSFSIQHPSVSERKKRLDAFVCGLGRSLDPFYSPAQAQDMRALHVVLKINARSRPSFGHDEWLKRDFKRIAGDLEDALASIIEVK